MVKKEKKALLERMFPKAFQMDREKYFVERGMMTKGFISKRDAMNYIKRKGGKLTKKNYKVV